MGNNNQRHSNTRQKKYASTTSKVLNGREKDKLIKKSMPKSTVLNRTVPREAPKRTVQENKTMPEKPLGAAARRKTTETLPKKKKTAASNTRSAADTVKRRSLTSTTKIPFETREKGKGVKSALTSIPLLAWLIVLIVILGTTYFSLTAFYKTHFIAGTTINGVDLSNKTLEVAVEKMNSAKNVNTLKIIERNGAEVLELSTMHSDQTEVLLSQVLEGQSPESWPAQILSMNPMSSSIAGAIDESKVDAGIKQLKVFSESGTVMPQDAVLVETKDGYSIQSEVVGNLLNTDLANAAIWNAINNNEIEVDLVKSGCYINPAVYSDNAKLNMQKDSLNSYFNTVITVDFDDRKKTIDFEEFQPWLVCQEDGSYTLDHDQVAVGVAEMAAWTDTLGGKRTFTTSGGEEIQLNGGDYGWCMDQGSTITTLMEAIESRQSQTIEPTYFYTAKQRTKDDVGDTYVEVSIKAQTVWFYKDGVLQFSTPVVTGDVAQKYDTPAGGVWAIDNKQRDATLEGEGYSSPVSYWMPFNGGVGFHDASWRTEFGGNIYQYSGSHGCVNMPPEYAELLYNSIDIGTPVIVY